MHRIARRKAPNVGGQVMRRMDGRKGIRRCMTTEPSSADLRLSAMRAFLGRIHPEMRLIAVTMKDEWITVTVVLDREPSERIKEDISEASTEIIADYGSSMKIRETIEIVTGSLRKEGRLVGSIIYQRAE